jgi:hypothetical protein
MLENQATVLATICMRRDSSDHAGVLAVQRGRLDREQHCCCGGAEPWRLTRMEQ